MTVSFRTPIHINFGWTVGDLNTRLVLFWSGKKSSEAKWLRFQMTSFFCYLDHLISSILSPLGVLIVGDCLSRWVTQLWPICLIINVRYLYLHCIYHFFTRILQLFLLNWNDNKNFETFFLLALDCFISYAWGMFKYTFPNLQWKVNSLNKFITGQTLKHQVKGDGIFMVYHKAVQF